MVQSRLEPLKGSVRFIVESPIGETIVWDSIMMYEQLKSVSSMSNESLYSTLLDLEAAYDKENDLGINFLEGILLSTSSPNFEWESFR